MRSELESLEVRQGEGLMGWVAEVGKPILNGNPAVEPGYAKKDGTAGLSSALALPLVSAGSVVGVVALYRRERDAFAAEELVALLDMCPALASLLLDSDRPRCSISRMPKALNPQIIWWSWQTPSGAKVKAGSALRLSPPLGYSSSFAVTSPLGMKNEIAFEMAASSIRFGAGVTREVGMDLADLGARKVLVITDPVLADMAPVQTVLESLESAGVGFVLYDRVRVEPTDESFLDAIAFAKQTAVRRLCRGGWRIHHRHGEGRESVRHLSAV